MQSSKFKKVFKDVVYELTLHQYICGGEKWQNLSGIGQREIVKYTQEKQMLLKEQ